MSAETSLYYRLLKFSYGLPLFKSFLCLRPSFVWKNLNLLDKLHYNILVSSCFRTPSFLGEKITKISYNFLQSWHLYFRVPPNFSSLCWACHLLTSNFVMTSYMDVSWQKFNQKTIPNFETLLFTIFNCQRDKYSIAVVSTARWVDFLKKLSTGHSRGERAWCFRGSEIKGHRNGQLGSLAELARSRPNRLSRPYLWPLTYDFKQNVFWTL